MIGGTRFIGAHVVRRLHDAGHAVVVFHRGASSNPVLPEIEHVLDPRAEYPITAFPSELQRDFDVVVHMVAMGEADTRAAVDAFEGRTGRLVLISSCDVYRAYGRLTQMEVAPPDALPLSETAPLRSALYAYRHREEQLGAFARDYDKVLAEAVMRNADGVDWTILRLPKVYGPEDNADLATIYGFSAVPEWRWTHGHVGNVATAIVLAATSAKAANEVFNVGEGHTPTMGERLAKLPPRPASKAEPPPFNFSQSLVLETSRIREKLGYAEEIEEEAAMLALTRSLSL
ncbi:NAD-dependent epimerase/dehydratase family protein [Aureimonas psammosilenae]|uniref:NAD-dependent epimerase/dehydratase family protein n=1 Tax=Aureimonas psammosilenae TaxID=2495496 RepID=UPI001869F4BE|nr:NAD-dependent epimerase/dehydratase family protein [Aureimonas psammosilenae]